MEPRERGLLRVVQELRRGGLAAADPGAQVPRAREHAHGQRGQPVRQPGDEAVQERPPDQSHDGPCRRVPAARGPQRGEDLARSVEVYLPLCAKMPTCWLVDNKTIMDDPFIQSYIGELLRSLRTQYLIDLIKPYTRLELSFLAKVPFYALAVYYFDDHDLALL